jgi:DNA invertase Pin-like site-specific DNA recombinase
MPSVVLVVTKLDRLARSTLDLLRIIDQIGREGAEFRSLGAERKKGRRDP